MLWPHLFPLYASHIFKAIRPPFAIELLRYGTRDHIGNFFLTHGQAMTRGRYISDLRAIQGYLYFLLHYSRSYRELFSENVTDDPRQITYLTSAN